MFRWLRGADGGLAEVEQLYTGMLADGRHVFDLAMSARVGGADPATVAEDLLATEERIDEAEREIRRRVIVHASVHGQTDLAACLMYMSIGKDAERVGDLSKGLFDIAEQVGAPPPGPLLDDLVAQRDLLSAMITEAGVLFAEDDREGAVAFIDRARDLQRWCTDRIGKLVREEVDVPQPAASAVTYRHLARIAANLLNIVSAVVVPLDRLDYPDRDQGE